MGAQKLNFFDFFEHRDYVVAKKSPDIEQKNDPRRERPRFPSEAVAVPQHQQYQQAIYHSVDITMGMARAAVWPPGMALPMPS
jgi:hypothetical protein